MHVMSNNLHNVMQFVKRIFPRPNTYNDMKCSHIAKSGQRLSFVVLPLIELFLQHVTQIWLGGVA